MFGIKRHVLVTVVNSVAGVNAPPKLNTNLDNSAILIEVTANKSLRDTRGNKYKNQRIIKEAFSTKSAQKVSDAFGLVGANFDQYSAFKRTDLTSELDRNDPVNIGDEIVLIHNDLINIDIDIIADDMSIHRIIPARRL